MKKIIVLTLASLSLMTGLAAAAQARPGRTTNAPPVVPTRVRNAEQSGLTSKLAKLHLKRGARPSARELKALGLKPVPKPLAARFKQLTSSIRARAAAAGPTYWFTYQYYGHFWADVYYDGPYFNSAGNTYYVINSAYKICDSVGGGCIGLHVYTEVNNINIDGTWYFGGNAVALQPDWAGLPVYGNGPYQYPSVAY